MHKLVRIGVLLVICFLNAFECSENNDPNQNSVMIHFMDYKREEFKQFLPSVKNAISSALKEYCANETADCGDFKKMEITPENIKFIGATEKDKFTEETRFIISNVFIDNEGSGSEPAILPKHTTLDFFKTYRDDIVKNGQVQIAYIDNELAYPQRNNLDNYLIVSISCAFCVALIVLNLVCQIRVSRQEKKKFLTEAQELKPLLKSPSNDGNNEKKIRNPSIHSEGSEARLAKPNSMSRHDSFDQKLDIKSGGGKRRKKNRNMVAGSVGSGIGSPRNLAENLDDDHHWDGQTYPENEHRRSKNNVNNSNYSINRNGEIQIPITYDRRNYQNEYPDSRVAYRLASNENL